MPRAAIIVDRQLLEDSINRVEGNGPIPEGKVKMYELVASDYNRISSTPITSSVVGLRIQQFNIQIKTKSSKGKRKMTPEHLAALKAGQSRATRGSRSQKFATPEAKQFFNRLRKTCPQRFHNIVNQYEKGSKVAGLKLKCLECSDYVTSEVRKCTVRDCAIYFIRPYQGSKEPEEK